MSKLIFGYFLLVNVTCAQVEKIPPTLVDGAISYVAILQDSEKEFVKAKDDGILTLIVEELFYHWYVWRKEDKSAFLLNEQSLIDALNKCSEFLKRYKRIAKNPLNFDANTTSSTINGHTIKKEEYSKLSQEFYNDLFVKKRLLIESQSTWIEIKIK